MVNLSSSEHPPPSTEPVHKLNRGVKDRLHQKLSSLVVDLVHHDIDLQFAKKELESVYIREILNANKGNIGLSAKALGMHRNTLSKRIKELKIPFSKN